MTETVATVTGVCRGQAGGRRGGRGPFIGVWGGERGQRGTESWQVNGNAGVHGERHSGVVVNTPDG